MNSDLFSDRLRKAIGEESANSFARRAGLGESLVRKYLAGSAPGIDKVAAIAAAANVRLEWLINGAGPMRGDEPALPAEVNVEILTQIIAATSDFLASSSAEMSPADRARLIAVLYSHFSGIDKTAIDDINERVKSQLDSIESGG